MSNTSHLGTAWASKDPGAFAEMEAFDQLPPELRAAIRDAPIPVGAVAASKGVAIFGVARAVQVLRDGLRSQLPSIVANTWGPDHPQAKHAPPPR